MPTVRQRPHTYTHTYTRTPKRRRTHTLTHTHTHNGTHLLSCPRSESDILVRSTHYRQSMPEVIRSACRIHTRNGRDSFFRLTHSVIFNLILMKILDEVYRYFACFLGCRNKTEIRISVFTCYGCKQSKWQSN